jgi:hypothetical protein
MARTSAQLPVVFNGVITECPVSEGEMQVVAISDGIELLNDLAPSAMQGSMPVWRLNAGLGGGMNPREMITTFMAPISALEAVNNAVVSNLLPGGFYYNFRNAYGSSTSGRPSGTAHPG